MATVEAPRQQAGYLAVQEKAKLRKVLRRFDLVLFTACAIVGLDTVAFAASVGAQAITWLLLSFVFFLIPYGVMTAELGSTFAFEGGPYEWVKMAFGDRADRAPSRDRDRRDGRPRPPLRKSHCVGPPRSGRPARVTVR